MASKDGDVQFHEKSISSNPLELSAPAARQAEHEKSMGFWEALRIYWRSTLWILYGQLVVFGYGIDGNIAGMLIAMPRFREDYGVLYGDQYIIPAWWQSLYAGISQLTSILGAFLTGILIDKIGHRYTNILSCVVSVIGVGVQYASVPNGSLGLLTAGKAINGFPIGMWLIIGPLYASEVAPLRLRGVLTSMTNIIQFSGVLLFTGITYQLGPLDSKIAYSIPYACQWIIPGFVLLTVWIWPESPVWHARHKRLEEARKTLDRIHGTDSTIDKEGILALIVDTIAIEDAQRLVQRDVTYADCFRHPNRHRTLISMFIYGCQYLSGIVFVVGYQSYYYQLVGYNPKKSFLLGMLNNVSMFIANILSWPILTTFGRRPLIVWGQLVCSCSLFIIAGASVPGTRDGYLVTVAFIFVWGFVYQCTLGAPAWTVVAEMPSLRLRSRTQGLANIVLCFTQWLITFIFPYMFNPDAGNLSGKVGFVFGATSFLGFLGCFFWLPETKDRTAAELDELFERGIPARKFNKTRVEPQEHAETVEKS